MTALLASEAYTVPVKPRRSGTSAPRRQVPVGAPPREASWVHVPHTPAAFDPAPAASLPVAHASGAGYAVARYEWTPRGLAVLLTLVAAVVLTMASTLVATFLAISPEAPGAAQGAPAVVSVAGR